MIISVIIFTIAIILLLLNLLKEISVFMDIKSNFYCSHCNAFNEEISHIGKCKKCNRTFKFKGGSWDHLILHRVNWILTNSKGQVYKWKEYKRLSLIEITITCTAICILIIAIILEVA